MKVNAAYLVSLDLLSGLSLEKKMKLPEAFAIQCVSVNQPVDK